MNELRPWDTNAGDVYIFVAIERDTKLVLACHVGRRSAEDTRHFIKRPECATTGCFQLTADGFEKYPSAIKL